MPPKRSVTDRCNPWKGRLHTIMHAPEHYSVATVGWKPECRVFTMEAAKWRRWLVRWWWQTGFCIRRLTRDLLRGVVREDLATGQPQQVQALLPGLQLHDAHRRVDEPNHHIRQGGPHERQQLLREGNHLPNGQKDCLCAMRPPHRSTESWETR